ncbi:MAG: ester cyclase [Chitinophagaceae bacterium]
MKLTLQSLVFILLTIVAFLCSACNQPANVESSKTDSVAANIKTYSAVWDDIINKGQLEKINDSNFTKDVIFHMKPANVVGIDSAKAYYANFLTGFSDIQFDIKDVFGQGDKIVKHWIFNGKHTGNFFGISPTGKELHLEGSTLVLMRDGKIAEEQDFFDNLDMLTQLGQIGDTAK